MALKLPTRKEIEAVGDMDKEKIGEKYKELMLSGEKQLARKLGWIAGYHHKHMFIKLYFPKLATHPFRPYHLQILDAIPNGQRNRNVNILAPRNSSKTTLCTLIYPIHRILYAPFDVIMGYYVEKFIVILTQNEDKMVRRMRELMDGFEKNMKIKRDFGDRATDTGVWAKNEFLVRLGINNECAIVVGLTRGKPIRGENVRFVRPTLIIIDDVDDVEELRNAQSREKDQSWFFSDVMPAGVPEITNFLFIDTLKHELALSAMLMDNPAWHTIFLRAFENPKQLKPHPTAEHLWERWEHIYTNKLIAGGDQKRLDAAEAFYKENKTEMTEGVVGLWLEMLSYKMIREYIMSRGYDYVMQEYQNDITHTTYRIFDMGNASTFTIENDGLWVEDSRIEEGMRHVKWDDLVGVSIYHDWAGGKDRRTNDFSAIVMVAWSKKIEGVDAEDTRDTMNGQYGYVIAATLERKPPDAQIVTLFNMADYAMEKLIHIPNLKIRMGYEEIVDGTGRANPDYRRSFMRQREKRGTQFHKLTIQSVPQSRVQKEIRIDTLAGPINYGWLSFNKDLDSEFINQLSQYPTADHDDGPDALEGATKMRLRPVEAKPVDTFYDEDDEFGDRLKIGNW